MTDTAKEEETMSNADESLTDRVKRSILKLEGDMHVDVKCDETKGLVTLVGTVKSQADKSLCGIITRTIPGVRRVENRLDVKP